MKTGSRAGADGPPPASRVRRMLGPASAAWEALLDPTLGRTTEWKRYRPTDPWSLRVYEGKRTVFWLTPVEGLLRGAVIIGEKAVAKALSGPLPRRLERELRDAPSYPEGRVVRFRMKSAARVGDIERLIDLKVGRKR